MNTTFAVPDGVARQRALVAMVAVMTALAVVCAGAMLVDDRTLLGVSVWLKPFKFGVSFAIFGATLAWMLSLPHTASRWTRWLGVVVAVTGVLDVGFIAVQAARGTFSHFNTADDPINAAGQSVFECAVPGLFFANVIIASILLFQRVGDRPLTWAIRSGMVFAVAGMVLGYTMGFHGKRTEVDANGRDVGLVSGHTVGGSDSAPGLPLTNWSTSGGDLRIAHFVGLHGMQIMLLLVFALGVLSSRYPRLRAESTRSALTGIVIVGYAGMLALLTWQALRGEPLTSPSVLTASLFAAIVASVLGLSAVVLRTPERRMSHRFA